MISIELIQKTDMFILTKHKKSKTKQYYELSLTVKYKYWQNDEEILEVSELMRSRAVSEPRFGVWIFNSLTDVQSLVNWLTLRYSK